MVQRADRRTLTQKARATVELLFLAVTLCLMSIIPFAVGLMVVVDALGGHLHFYVACALTALPLFFAYALFGMNDD